MTKSEARELTFSVLVEKTEGVFVGHCLETGLVAVADEQSDVLSAMSKLLERQIAFAIENGRMDGLYHGAPKEIWAKWMSMEERMVKRSQRELSNGAQDGLGPQFIIAENTYAAHC